MNKMKFTVVALSSLLLFSCGGGKEKEEQPAENTAASSSLQKPTFNADTAYQYIETQLSFGPRVPGTAAQKQCAAWMQEKLTAFCDTVYVQNVEVRAGNAKMLPCINIIGSLNPKAKNRILLLAHWDSRPWADMDTKDQDKAIAAADDGASGVAVLMELARAIQNQPLPADLGIDILLTDAEDYGKTEWGDESYALGTQYWALHPHLSGYKADFGILLDMVGGRNARFPIEGYSAQLAQSVVQRVWQAAGQAGYSSYFVYDKGATITDDHFFVNQIAKIPTIDIISLSTSTQSSFAPHWHTHQDDMNIIDKNTLKAVGETLLQVIYDYGRPSGNS